MLCPVRRYRAGNYVRDLWRVVAARSGKPDRQTAGASSRTPHELRRPAISVNEQHHAKYVCRAQHATTPARKSGALGAPVLCPYAETARRGSVRRGYHGEAGGRVLLK